MFDLEGRHQMHFMLEGRGGEERHGTRKMASENRAPKVKGGKTSCIARQEQARQSPDLVKCLIFRHYYRLMRNQTK